MKYFCSLLLLALLLARAARAQNVGIGTTGPTTTLDVRTATTGTPAITVGKTDNTAGALYLGNSSHGVKRGYNAVNDVGLYTTSGSLYLSGNGTSTSQFVLTNGGSVGIGLSGSPGQRLDVLGSGRFASAGPSLQLAGTGTGSHTYAEFYPNGTGGGRGAYLGYPGNGSLNLTIANELSGGDLVGVAPHDVYFSAGGSPRLFVGGSEGQVGIGTTTPNPSAALEVQSTSKGLLLPRLTQTQMLNVARAEPGLLVFNTTANAFYGYRSASTVGSIAQNTYNSQLISPGGGPLGQSFTATANATLTAITAYLGLNSGASVTDNVTLRVYAGSGVSGTLLGSVTQAVTLTTGFPPPATTFTLPPGIVVAPGSQYTFVMSRASAGQLAMLVQNADVYPGGILFVPSALSAYDMRFVVDLVVTGEWVALN